MTASTRRGRSTVCNLFCRAGGVHRPCRRPGQAAARGHGRGAAGARAAGRPAERARFEPGRLCVQPAVRSPGVPPARARPHSHCCRSRLHMRIPLLPAAATCARATASACEVRRRVACPGSRARSRVRFHDTQRLLHAVDRVLQHDVRRPRLVQPPGRRASRCVVWDVLCGVPCCAGSSSFYNLDGFLSSDLKPLMTVRPLSAAGL